MGREIPVWSILKFFEKFLGYNFALSDAEDNTSEPLNRRRIADLPLLRTLIIGPQKSQEPSFWKVIEFFVLLEYAKIIFKDAGVDFLF